MRRDLSDHESVDIFRSGESHVPLNEVPVEEHETELPSSESAGHDYRIVLVVLPERFQEETGIRVHILLMGK